MQTPAIWFPTVRTGTGTDVFTERLAHGLKELGLQVQIDWIPLRAEYLPWTVQRPIPPKWANLAHVNTWLPSRFLPGHLPILATVHHAAHHPDNIVYKSTLKSLYHRAWIAPNERRVLRRAQIATAVSRFAANTAKETLIEMEIDVIYNGVDINHFTPRERGPATSHPFRLLYVGGWKSLKGVDILPEIMMELGDNYELHYTGGHSTNTARSPLPRNMKDTGILKGSNAVVEAMHSADALLFPSRSEGFGLVAAEAMACGLPVIGTMGTSISEVVDDGKSGILCMKDNAKDFAIAIRKLATDGKMYADMTSHARRRVESLFSSERMLEKYLEKYQNMISHIS